MNDALVTTKKELLEKLRKCFLAFGVNARISSALLAFHRCNPELTELFMSYLSDADIAKCYITLYGDLGASKEEITEQTAVMARPVSASRAFMAFGKTSVACPFCSNELLFGNDDIGTLFAWCSECGFSVKQSSEEDGFVSMARRIESLSTKVVKRGIISIDCPNCKSEIYLFNDQTRNEDLITCWKCKSKFPEKLIEKMLKERIIEVGE